MGTNFLFIIGKYPKLFPIKYIDINLFANIYFNVLNRCFGGGLTSLSVVPMADNLNHNNVRVNFEIMHAPSQTADN